MSGQAGTKTPPWQPDTAVPLHHVFPLNLYMGCYLLETEAFRACFYSVPNTTKWWSCWRKIHYTMLWLEKGAGKLIGSALLGFHLPDFLMTPFVRKRGSVNTHTHVNPWISRGRVGTKAAHWLWIIAAELDLLSQSRVPRGDLKCCELRPHGRMKK